MTLLRIYAFFHSLHVPVIASYWGTYLNFYDYINCNYLEDNFKSLIFFLIDIRFFAFYTHCLYFVGWKLCLHMETPPRRWRAAKCHISLTSFEKRKTFIVLSLVYLVSSEGPPIYLFDKRGVPKTYTNPNPHWHFLLEVFEQGGIFIVPHLPWHGTSGLRSYSKTGPLMKSPSSKARGKATHSDHIPTRMYICCHQVITKSFASVWMYTSTCTCT